MTAGKKILLAGTITVLALLAAASAQERMVIQADDVQRRTCPSTQCGIVGRFFSGEQVPVYESVNGWSRVSDYYSAACYEGRSIFVEHGPSDCAKANGIVQGEFAEWVKSEFLAEEDRT
jgi:uncharacterized protein YraI